MNGDETFYVFFLAFARSTIFGLCEITFLQECWQTIVFYYNIFFLFTYILFFFYCLFIEFKERKRWNLHQLREFVCMIWLRHVWFRWSMCCLLSLPSVNWQSFPTDRQVILLLLFFLCAQPKRFFSCLEQFYQFNGLNSLPINSMMTMIIVVHGGTK